MEKQNKLDKSWARCKKLLAGLRNGLNVSYLKFNVDVKTTVYRLSLHSNGIFVKSQNVL